MKAYIGMPCYTDVAANPMSVAAATLAHGLKIPFCYKPRASSLLPKAFNLLYAEALNLRCDYFFMLHADVVPDCGWAGKLLELLIAHNADVVSVAIPIKNDKGLNSCGIGDPDNRWAPLFRFTQKQLQQLPPTFTAADIGWPGYPLLVNSGCWVANLNRPWCRETDAQGVLKACFSVPSQIRHLPQSDVYAVDVESEDWYYSRQLHDLGCKVMVTREVAVQHFGTKSWSSEEVVGQERDYLADRAQVTAAIAHLEQVGQQPLCQDAGLHDRGYWLDADPGHEFFDEPLAAALVEACGELGCEDVLDLGCGLGKYTRYFRQRGLACRGVDGNPLTPQFSDGACEVADLSQPLETTPADVVFSIEVGEHIPAEYEQTFLDNVAQHAKRYVVLSWAVPQQHGRGHVNCREPQYVTDQMQSRGFVRHADLETRLRAQATLGYLKRVMVFARPELAPTETALSA